MDDEQYYDFEDYLLACLSEECAEIIKNVCKAQRFGLNSDYMGVTNRDEIFKELNDLMGVVQMLQDHGTLSPLLFDEEMIEGKKAKVQYYWEIFNVGQE